MSGGYDPVVQIPVADGPTRLLAGALFEPEGAGPFPAVIILSGCGGVADDVGIVARINAAYLPKGIATLVLDSFTPRGYGDICSMPRAVTIHQRAQDAYAALAWLGRRKEIDAKHVFLQGYSHGASAAISAIDPANAAGHAPGFAGVIAFFPYCYSAASRFPVPTLMLIGAEDVITPLALCQRIEDRTNLEVIVYPGAGHSFATPGQVNYLEPVATDAQRRAGALIDALVKQAAARPGSP
jgi:dienelactone hydrolase